ncbi:MAG TPA: Uma2 family endonuclease [Dehalococcoidia bacterium]|nr:Uma2 family endonuclease [Dehalococcoidia bacterium]
MSDTTVAFDRTEKMPRYAAAGIPEFWLINLPARAIEVCRDVRTLRPGDQIDSAAQTGVEIGVADLLGPEAEADTAIQ